MPTRKRFLSTAEAAELIGLSKATLEKDRVTGRPGVVEVELLPEVPTEDYAEYNLSAKRDELWQLFAQRLAICRPRSRRFWLISLREKVMNGS